MLLQLRAAQTLPVSASSPRHRVSGRCELNMRLGASLRTFCAPPEFVPDATIPFRVTALESEALAARVVVPVSYSCVVHV